MGSDLLVGWLEGRLSDERAFLEGRHEDICEDLRMALRCGAELRPGAEPPVFRGGPQLVFAEQLAELQPTLSPMQLQGFTGLDTTGLGLTHYLARLPPASAAFPPPPRRASLGSMTKGHPHIFLDSALAMPGKPEARAAHQHAKLSGRQVVTASMSNLGAFVKQCTPLGGHAGSSDGAANLPALEEEQTRHQAEHPDDPHDTDDDQHKEGMARASTLGREIARDEALHEGGSNDSPTGNEKSLPMLTRLVSSGWWEASIAFLILASAIVMTLEVQYKSVSLAEAVEWADAGGEPPSELSWPGAEQFFLVCSFFFGFAFTIEVVLKLIVQGREFVHSGWSVFDVLVVFFWFVETWSQYGMPVNPMIFRVVRLLRLLRLLRFVKMIEFFDVLSLMVGSIKASVSVLFWGTVVLVMIMLMFGMFLNSLLTETMENPDLDMGLRKQIYEYFGSFSRVMITMFEITLGNWVPVCRLLSDNVSEWYGFIFLVYRCVVGFAVVKVITGVFLHETFKCAAMDDDLMVQAKERQKTKFKKKMLKLVAATDSSGDGQVSLSEFKEIVKDPRVLTWLQAMEFNVTDPVTVFSYFAGDEFRTSNIHGESAIHADDLCRGISRLKGGAQQLDLLMLMAQTREIQLSVEDNRWEVARAFADLEELMRRHSEGADATSLRARGGAASGGAGPLTSGWAL